MNEENAGRRIVLCSLPLTVLFTAAVLFFGLRYAESEPLVFLAAALILTVSAVITGKLLKTHQQPRWILFVWFLPAVFLIGFAYVSQGKSYTAHSQRESQQTAARQIVNAAVTAISDMESEGCPLPESPYIVQGSEDPEPDSLAARIAQYESNVARGESYAVILNRTAKGSLTVGVYWAPFSVLTPDTLTETPAEEQQQQLGRLFIQKPPVFYEESKPTVFQINDRPTEG